MVDNGSGWEGSAALLEGLVAARGQAGGVSTRGVAMSYGQGGEK